MPVNVKGLSYLRDVLALKLGDEGVQALIVSLNADGRENGLDILGGRAGVATEAEEEESGDVLHFVCCDYIEERFKLGLSNFAKFGRSPKYAKADSMSPRSVRKARTKRGKPLHTSTI